MFGKRAYEASGVHLGSTHPIWPKVHQIYAYSHRVFATRLAIFRIYDPRNLNTYYRTPRPRTLRSPFYFNSHSRAPDLHADGFASRSRTFPGHTRSSLREPARQAAARTVERM